MKYKLYNDDLCEKLWNKKNGEYEIIKNVRKNLLKISLDFMKEALKNVDFSVKIHDVILVGSSANYNYTKYSDIDLHLVVDFDEIKCDEKIVKLMFDNMRGNWNKNHNIKIKDHDVEIYVQDINEKPESGAVYSIKNEKWIKKPNKENIEFDKKLIKQKHKKYKSEIENVIKTKNPEAIKSVLEKIYNYRKAGLQDGGEFSTENLVFKILRAQKYIGALKNLEKIAYDKKMSLNETSQNVKILHENDWLSLMQMQTSSGPYVYSHETRCNGNIIAVLLYKKFGRDGWQYGVRKETTPCWSDKPVLSSLTGGVDFGDTPVQAALKEIKEEAGYDCEEKDLQLLGTCRGTKSCDTVYHLYALDVAGLKRGEITGEDTGEIVWIYDHKDKNSVQCPIFYTMYSRLGFH